MARRPQPRPPVKTKDFTVAELDRGIEKLRRRIDEVNRLDPAQMSLSDARVTTAESNIRDTIRDVFGDTSPEFRDHEYHAIRHGPMHVGASPAQIRALLQAGIPQTVLMLEGLIERLEEKRIDLIATDGSEPERTQHVDGSRRVFVVHGHDDAAKLAVSAFLRDLDLEPIVLSEQPGAGRTLIEKFERESNVEFAVVLLTPDDLGHARDEPEAARPRARQNVILELGYFVGQLTRARVCALHKGSVELPSDYHGVEYIPMDESDGWKLRLAKEIKQQIEIDLNRAV